MGTGPVPPLAPISAPADIMATARANCAARLRLKCHDAEAEAFERGDRDEAWSMRFEVMKLKSERDTPGD